MRVIAGTAKGVRLSAPRQGTRPTTDRVREAVFSLLADWAGTGGGGAADQLAGLGVLDLFAGSGAVAVEAASRGATPVVAVDSDAVAARLIQANATAAGVSVKAVRATVDGYLRGTPVPFDVIWLDPPYDLPEAALAGVLNRVAAWLAADGLVAVERSRRTPAPGWPPGLAQRWDKRYGETVVYFATEGLK